MDLSHIVCGVIDWFVYVWGVQVDASHIRIKVFAFDSVALGAWWDFQNHISPFARILIVEEGCQSVSFHGETYHQKPGEMLLIPPYASVDYSCEHYCRQCYFIFTAKLSNGNDLFADYEFPVRRGFGSWHQVICENLLLCLPNFGLKSLDADDEFFNQLIFETKLEDLSLQQKIAAQGAVSVLLAEFAEGAQLSSDLIRFTKAFQHIENHLDGDLSLSVLSEIEGMSNGYFSDEFNRRMGIRPSEYIARKRETKARELLTGSSVSIAEVARQVGMSDLSYFFRFFKKRVGVTPRIYRMERLGKD